MALANQGYGNKSCSKCQRGSTGRVVGGRLYPPRLVGDSGRGSPSRRGLAPLPPSASRFGTWIRHIFGWSATLCGPPFRVW